MFLALDDRAVLACFVTLRSWCAANRWRLFVSDPARSAFARPRLSAYSLPSIGATCGASLSRYGRPIPNSLPCASIHFHKFSLEIHRSKSIIQLQFEAPIHASDHVIHERHADFLCRLRILPREVLVDELYNSFDDSPRFSLLLDRHLYPLRHLDGIDFRGPLVHRP